ncbi:MAG: PrsW family glutamic-type intramembrane protease [Bacteroidota bacterium]
MTYLLFLLPVLLFGLLLLLLDSFKLIKTKTLLISSIWGLISAWLSLRINVDLIDFSWLKFSDYSRYVAPLLEEFLKMAVFIYLIKKGKVGFMIDGAIYGFAAGALFSVFENITYFMAYEDMNIMVMIIRGFGTALMHGGCTAIILMFTMGSLNTKHRVFAALAKGTLIAAVIHSGYNQLMFVVSPLWLTIAVVISIPLIIMIVFMLNETGLRKWLDVELSQEVELLKMMREGRLGQTKTGEYIISIKKNFSSEVIMDMMNYLRLYSELSLHAKKIILLKETGFPVSRDEETISKLAELKALKKEIGQTGIIAISPVLRMSQKDIWKINMLEA